MDCVFCKIIKGELPALKVYENDKVVAFLDIHPVNPGHTLVVPREHCENILDCGEDIAREMAIVTKKVAKAIVKAFDLKGFNVMANNGAVAGQVVPHMHWHIVPRFPDDGLRLWSGKNYEEGQAEKMAEKIKAALL